MATTKKRSLWNFAERFEGDKVVWIIVLMLILLSIVCIFSSTSRLLEGSQTRIDMVREQLFIVAVGLGVIIICYNIKNIAFFRWCSKWGFLLSLLLLVFLDSHASLGPVKAIGLNGAYRIIQIPGMQIHVFEVVKIAMVMYLSWALDALKKGELKGPEKEIWQKIAYIYAPALLTMVLILPGSNSSALFIGGIMFITILLGGGNFKDLALLFAAGVVLIGICFGLYSATKSSEHPLFQRIGTGISRVFEDDDLEAVYLSPTSTMEQKQKAIDGMRQPYSAKIAIKEGGILGKGPGQSTQRYVVPDISEDFMFSFIVEEYGIVGAIIVIILYVSLLARASIIVRNCGKDNYAKLVVAGLSILITGQAFLHMLVNVDIGPMTGQTLPLISHGKSAFLCFSLAFGVILSFSRIAAGKIERETLRAEPLMEMHEAREDEVRESNPIDDGMDALDAYESGNMNDTDYGI
jgi:cell division protein FtsW